MNENIGSDEVYEEPVDTQDDKDQADAERVKLCEQYGMDDVPDIFLEATVSSIIVSQTAQRSWVRRTKAR